MLSNVIVCPVKAPLPWRLSSTGGNMRSAVDDTERFLAPRLFHGFASRRDSRDWVTTSFKHSSQV